MKLLNNKTKKNNQRGTMIVVTIVFSTIFITMAGGLLSLLVYQNKLAKKTEAKEAALQIAEAGINYYRWHLAHYPEDFTNNGQNGSGVICAPCVINYTDIDGSNIIGTYELTITPPLNGAKTVTIRSKGWITNFPNQSRIVEVKFGEPSLAQYSVISEYMLNFTSGATINGPIHSNDGVLFDGISVNNLVTSSVNTFSYLGATRFGVTTRTDPVGRNPDPTPASDYAGEAEPFGEVTNADLPDQRDDIFIAGRIFPVAEINFTDLAGELGNLRDEAVANGVVIDNSEELGWHIQFINGNEFQYRKVTGTSPDCDGIPVHDITGYHPDDWVTDTIPNNSVIFVKDYFWIDSQDPLNDVRVTIVAAEEDGGGGLDDGEADIYINNSILYDSHDGTEVLGLIAQNNITVGLHSEDDLVIEGALIAQKGQVWRPGYTCADKDRNSITIYGAIATKKMYRLDSFTYRNINYDNNLYYAPPPAYPTTGEYTFLSWEEKLPGE